MDSRFLNLGVQAGRAKVASGAAPPSGLPATAARRSATGRRAIAQGFGRFHREEDGAFFIFGLMIFTLMIFITGISLDIERFETARTKLQNTADGAALAAASLTQDVDGKTLVKDYFTKAGLAGFVDLDDITVVKELNFKRVTVNSDINVPTHFFNRVGIENLGTIVSSIAEESIGDVEISMVLDVSGSMSSNSKLANLKVAAGDFIDSIYKNAETGSVSTSIIPYSYQVTAGPDIMALLNRTPLSHEKSYCLDFVTDDFSTATMVPTDPVRQALHFDPTTHENTSWKPTYSLWNVACPTNTWREILPYSQDTTALKNYINAFSAGGNTSVEIGVKWGAALLDPEFDDVVTGLISANKVDNDFHERPLDYNAADGLKVMLVMTDGENTSHYEMDDPYRTGDSFVYVFYDNQDRPYYSIWGGNGEPNPDGDTHTETHTQTVQTGNCLQWYWYPYWCQTYETVTTTYDVEVEEDSWYLANDYSNDGVSTGHRFRPYGDDSATRMTWDQLWENVPVEFFADEYLAEMGGMNTERTEIKDARDLISSGTKNTRTAAICAAAKNAGVLIYVVGFEVKNIGSTSRTLLKNCATTYSHYFDVEGTDISKAFSAIAADINRLRLIQ